MNVFDHSFSLCYVFTLFKFSGLTVHEANLEENEITFDGFPWTLRLRYIMEYASDLQQGRYKGIIIIEFVC